MFLNQSCGVFTLVSYMANVFEASGSHFDPNVSSMIFASVQIVGTLVASQIVDRLGRKILLVVSLAGSSLGLIAMGAFQYTFEQGYSISSFDWVPVTSLSFVVLTASLGIVPLPFVVIAEVLPLKLRSIGSTICMVALTTIAFSYLKVFPVLSEVIRLYSCMWIFASICFFGVFFVVFYMDETKGKVLDLVKRRASSIVPI